MKKVLYKKDFSNTIPNYFYKNAYSIWRNKNIIYEPHNLNVIKNDWIYDHILLTDDDGRVFKPPGYYTEENTPSYVPRFFKDLPVAIPLRDLNGIFRTLIPKLNRAFHRIKFTNRSNIFFSMAQANDKVSITNGAFKSIYTTILSSKIKLNMWEQKWKEELNISDDSLVWENIWNVIHNGIVNYNVQSSIWEMVHRNFISGYILKLMHKSDGICKLCKKLERQRTHIFMHCEVIHYIFNHFSNIIHSFDNSIISQKEKAFGIFEEINEKILLRNYMTFSIRHIIYRNRNMDVPRGGNVKSILIKKLISYIRKDLMEMFDRAKLRNKIECFKSRYLIEEIFGKVQNNQLVLNI